MKIVDYIVGKTYKGAEEKEDLGSLKETCTEYLEKNNYALR